MLLTVGGLDIAGLVGVCIGGALYHIPVVLDGVIGRWFQHSAAGRLLFPELLILSFHHMRAGSLPWRFCVSTFRKAGHRASLALGEGTGAVMMFALLDMALSVYKGRTTFDDISVSQYGRGTYR